MMVTVMRIEICIIYTAFASLPAAGCTSNYIPQPTTINLEDAMVDSVRAFRAAQKAGLGKIKMSPCILEVKFNVTGSATDSDKLGLTAGPTAGVIPATLALTGSVEQSISGGRQNNITATFVTPYTECKFLQKPKD
ncbi:MAG: hypothetical protein U1E25_10635 [Methylocystis sp.]